MRSDQTVILTSFESASAYPDALRRVSYFDAETNKRLKFLTNNFVFPATITSCRASTVASTRVVERDFGDKSWHVHPHLLSDSVQHFETVK